MDSLDAAAPDINSLLGSLLKDVATKLSLYQALNTGIEFTERNFDRISDLSVKLTERIALIFFIFLIYLIIQNSINHIWPIPECP